MRGSSAGTGVRIVTGLTAAAVTLTVLLWLFTGRMESMRDRRDALLLAGSVIASMEGAPFPETGLFDSATVAGGCRMRIRRVVSEVSPGVREMRLFVGKERGTEIELVRRYYDTGIIQQYERRIQ